MESASGLRDVLLECWKPVMERYRVVAGLLRMEVQENEDVMVKKGWAAEFVCRPMGDMAESAMLVGPGNCGDVVRVVVAVIEVMVEGSGYWESVDRIRRLSGGERRGRRGEGKRDWRLGLKEGSWIA